MIDSFKGLVKLVRSRNVQIDDMVFRLHCLYTSMLLLFFFLIITTKQFGGEPIDCDTNHDTIKGSVLNVFCLTHFTYTIKDAYYKKIGEDVIAPGIKWGDDDEDKELKHNYYQWIWFIFFIEAVFFYTPRYLWKNFENGTIARLVSMDENSKKTRIAEYLKKNAEHNTDYARNYFYFVVLAFCNVVIQLFFIDQMFNGEFIKYGIRVFDFMSENPEVRRDALIKVWIELAN